MKNQLIVYLLFIGLTSCTAMQRGSSGTTASTSKTAPSRSANPNKSPVFLEHISIKTDNSQQSSSKKVNRQHPALATESAMVLPAMSVELLIPQQFKYAILLDVPVEEVTDYRLIEYIDSWYGTPYRFGGSDKNGVDCSSFVQNFMQAIYGVLLPRISADQYQQTKRINKSVLQEGDLVFFSGTRGRRLGITHVGIYLRNNKFVHASTSGGVMISDLEEPYYHQHYSAAGRVREMVVSK